jgi:hypothetical protein
MNLAFGLGVIKFLANAEAQTWPISTRQDVAVAPAPKEAVHS